MKIKSLILSVIFACCTFTLPAQANITNRIVATINNDIITSNQLNKITTFYILQAKASAKANKQPFTQPSLRSFKKQVLNQLIETKLLAQQASQTSINSKVTPEIVQQKYKSITATAQKEHINLPNIFKQAGFSHKDTLALYKEEILAATMRQQIMSEATVSKQQVNETRKEATYVKLIDYITQNKNFANHIAAQLTAHKNIKNTGNFDVKIMDRPYTQLPDLFQKALVNKHANAIIGPINSGENGNGWHILKIQSIKLKQQEFNATVQQLREKSAQIKLKQWMKKARTDSYIQNNFT